MKKLILPLLLCGTVLSATAAAQTAVRGPGFARVLSSRAVMAPALVAEPYRICQTEPDEATGMLAPQCRSVMAQREEQRIESYDVTYLYNGRVYRTRMPYDPGSRVPLRGGVQPGRN
ncbi:MAG TPA: hypothetical protein VLI06_10190 [Solimonas sp.]|nr:hypothetical protein [Solimonas sp.]